MNLKRNYSKNKIYDKNEPGQSKHTYSAGDSSTGFQYGGVQHQ
jgi:hypothetical protein